MSFKNSIEVKTDSESDTDTESDQSCNSSIKNLENNNLFDNLSKLINNLNLVNMATPVLKREYLDMVPEFHGDTKLLSRFIEICEKLVNKFYVTSDPGDFQNEWLMSSILAKIKGEAAVNIASCTISDWASLKKALLNTYQDKRDCFTLNIEMTELKQNNENAFEFFNRVQEILNLQVSYLTNQLEATNAKVLIAYFQTYAVRILLRGLKDPLGHLLRTKNPQDLNSALNMLTNEFQLESKQRHQNFNIKQKQLPINQNINNRSPFVKNNPQLIYRPLPSNNFNKPPQIQNQFVRQNVFKPNTNHNFTPKQPTPTPMSISTNQSFRPKPGPSGYNNRPHQPHFFQRQPNRAPDFIVEELHNTDLQDLEQINYDDGNLATEEIGTNYENYEEQYDENNFLEQNASETK